MSLKHMMIQKRKMADGLLADLKSSFNDASFQIGHGIAKDKDENMSYFFKIHATDTPKDQVAEAASSFFAKSFADAKIIIRTDTEKPLNPEAENKETFDLGIGYIGSGIRNKR